MGDIPLRRLIIHINQLAAGDLSGTPPDVVRFNREISQLCGSITAMQLGLQQLVTQVSEATTAMVENIGSLAQGIRSFISSLRDKPKSWRR